MAESGTFVYRVAGGCSIGLDVQPALTGGAAPVIVWIHGGALIRGNRRGVHPVVWRLLSERGFAQVSLDYRLAPETKLPEIIDDLRAAFRYIAEELPSISGIDPSRVGVIGGSAGGYLTLMSGFAVDPRPSALVALYGYGDLVGSWYRDPDAFYRRQPLVDEATARSVVGDVEISDAAEGHPDRGLFYVWCRQNGRWPQEVVGYDPRTQDDAFTPFSPDRNVTPAFPPTLLIHGDADTDVPYQRSVDMARVLAAYGVEHRLTTIEGGPHGFDFELNEQNWQETRDTLSGEALRSIVDWFVAHV